MLFSFDGCDACTLKREWPKLYNPKIPFTYPTEQSDARIVVLGESPGATDDETNSNFSGDSGKRLRSAIPREWENKLYWSNAVRCHPNNNKAVRDEDVQCCQTFLNADLDKIKPHAILVCGNVALNQFWRGGSVTAKRDANHGLAFPIQLKDKSWIWCYPTFNPNEVIRATDKRDGNNTLQPVFEADIRRFFNAIPDFLKAPDIPPIPKKEDIIYPKSIAEVKALFARLKEPFGLDIETFKLKPYKRDAAILSAAFSDGDLTFAFPVRWPGHMIQWGFEALEWCMAQNRTFIAHNAPFELAWLWYNFPQLNLSCSYEDTEASARVKYERGFLLSLDDQTKLVLGFHIKEICNVDVKNLLLYPMDYVLYYNALDAWSCWHLHKRNTLTPIQQENYDRIIRVQRSTVMMELTGMPVDLQMSESLKRDYKLEQDGVVSNINASDPVQRYTFDTKRPFDIAAPVDVGNVLVNYCGLTLPQTEKSGQWSTDESDLQQYQGKNQLVDLLLEWRDLNKNISTYIEPILSGTQLGVDGWLHSSYSACLTRTGRLSSKEPNFQNWPKRKNREIRKQVIPPKGFVIASADYGQLEARVLCMAAGDMKLRQAFIDEEDIHSKWLNKLLMMYPTYLDRLAQKTDLSEEKAIRKAGRDIIKTDFVFASFYGSEAKSVSTRTSVPLNICEELLYEFWTEYKDVKRCIDELKAAYNRNGFVQSLTGLVRSEHLPGNEFNNSVIQGTAAHIVLEAQIALFEYALTNNHFAIMPRYNIHDDIGFIMPNDDTLEENIRIASNLMTEPRFSFSTVPLMVEMKISEKNWSEMEVVGKFKGKYI